MRPHHVWVELLSFLKYFEVQLSKTHTESTEYIKTAIIKTRFEFFSVLSSKIITWSRGFFNFLFSLFHGSKSSSSLASKIFSFTHLIFWACISRKYKLISFINKTKNSNAKIINVELNDLLWIWFLASEIMQKSKSHQFIAKINYNIFQMLCFNFDARFLDPKLLDLLSNLFFVTWPCFLRSFVNSNSYR